MAHGNVKNVLIIGGGDGATLRETLKHTDVKVWGEEFSFDDLGHYGRY
jgi:hypothetical protein